MLDNLTPEVGKVLDFGSGKVPRQTELLRQAGFDVTPHDVYENRVLGVHASDADIYINYNWDVILLSNVLNVQFNMDKAADLVAWALAREPRMVIFNLPNEPCYWDNPRQFGPKMWQNEILVALSIRGVHPDRVQQHPYSGGVLYVIDNHQAPKEQPKFLSTRFGY